MTRPVCLRFKVSCKQLLTHELTEKLNFSKRFLGVKESIWPVAHELNKRRGAWEIIKRASALYFLWSHIFLSLLCLIWVARCSQSRRIQTIRIAAHAVYNWAWLWPMTLLVVYDELMNQIIILYNRHLHQRTNAVISKIHANQAYETRSFSVLILYAN